MISDLEILCESIGSEIDEIESVIEKSQGLTSDELKQLQTCLKNLARYNDSVYHVYECCPDTESRIGLYEQILGEKLTWQEKQELRIKHQIDLL
jgi:hypothetical protein